MSASKYEYHHMPYLRSCKHVICYPTEGGAIVENHSLTAGALRGNLSQRFKEQLKVNGSLWQPTTVSPSILGASCTKGGRSTVGWWVWGVFQDHNFPWVMNCEMQQKPPLLQEGFKARRAIEEREGVKMPSSNKIHGREKISCVIEIRLKAHTLHIMHGSSNPESEESF